MDLDPPSPDENSWIRACLDINLELIIVVSSKLECHIIIITWDFSGKSLALMTGCILYQLKVLSVKLGGVMCQNLDSK